MSPHSEWYVARIAPAYSISGIYQLNLGLL